MFESIKKKFSRTSNKLADELKEEAKNENNIQTIIDAVAERDKLKEEPAEEVKDSSEDKKDKSSIFSFFSSNKKEEPVEEEQACEDEEDSSEDEEEESSRFSFFSSNKKEEPVEEEQACEDEEISSEDEEEESSRFSFFSKESDNEKSSIFSFIKEKTISEKHVEDILWDLEMGLLEGDVALEVASTIVNSVKNELVGKKIKRSRDIEEYTYTSLRNAVSEILDIPSKSMTDMIEDKKSKGEPLVVMFVGINGTGKTTTIGKLANYYLKKGYTPVIAASDTFRAGAIEQVSHHADNVGVKIIKHQKGSDPAAVAYDAVSHAKAQGKELVLIDTAGRMQTNTNLMDEMKKIKRVAKPDLVVFVGDALTGNDATEQASKFNDAIDIDGVILTKADADSKGGASLSIGYVIKKPIMFLGVGQEYDDIMEYDSEWMIRQLFDEEEVAIEE